MSFTAPRFTDEGKALQAKAQAGTALKFTKMQLGDGELGSQAIAAMTGLINPLITVGISDVKAGKLEEDTIDEKVFSSYLDTRELPDPDLLIRTSGEQRLSNYLLWQLAYSEFYFTDVPWPDFHKKELELAVEAYNSRDRRFGGLKEE